METRLTTNMLDQLVAGMQQSAEDFLASIKPRIAAKKDELAKSEFADSIPSMEAP